MIYFVRHGESEANLKRLFAGQREDSLLTENGENQALETAKVIKSQIPQIDRIISSPLKRTLKTAQIIAKEIGFDESKIEIDKRITEYDMGALTGKPNYKIDSLTMTSAEGAENPDEFKERVFSCIQELSKSPETILIVSHAGVGRILESIKSGGESNMFYDFKPYPNGSVHIIDWIT